MSSNSSRRGRSWYRTLGRLHRYTEVMRHLLETSEGQEERNSSRSTEYRSPPITISSTSSVGPTDPDVYNAQQPAIPNPAPIYDLPRLHTPTQLLEQLLNDIDEEATNNMRTPPPAYHNVSPQLPYRPPLPERHIQFPQPRSPESTRSTQSEHSEQQPSLESRNEEAYLQMLSNTATRGSTATQTTPDASTSTHSFSPPAPQAPEDERQHLQPTEPARGYDANTPGNYNHPLGERAIPIPQGSPPIQPPIQRPIPIYYRDYNHPDVFPAYRLICHSVWYVQVSQDVIICPKCATSDHTFCITNRPLSVWRHLHVISREFHHTTMHCGRCYKLLMKTRRAIDCYQCRSQVIENARTIERLVYKVLCEIVIPRTLT